MKKLYQIRTDFSRKEVPEALRLEWMYVSAGVQAQLLDYFDGDWDAEVDEKFLAEVIEKFPPYPRLTRHNLVHTMTGRFAVMGEGEIIHRSETAEDAREVLRDFEREEKAEGTYTPDFYTILDLESGEVVLF